MPEEPLTASWPLLDDADDCALGYRGTTLDLGNPGAEMYRGFSVDSRGDVEWITREGSPFARFTAARVSYDLWLDRELRSVALSAKVRGAGARHLSASLNDQHLGIIRLDPEKTRVAHFPTKEVALGPGRHRLTLSFLGRPRTRGASASQGEIAWVHLAESHPKTLTDTPPTRLDSFASVALDDKPHRAVALRPQSSLSCPLWVPARAHLKVSLGLWGQGQGQAEILALRDDAPALSLGLYDLRSERGWQPVDVPLTELAGQLVRIVLLAHETTGGARVTFGEPRVEQTRDPMPPALLVPAKRALVIVLAGLGRKHAPPASRSSGLPTLARFAQRATYFSGYRTPSTLSATVMASLLTGREPRRHGLETLSLRLSDEVGTIAELVRAESGRAAFFTAVPTSFGDFGFDRGWEVFQAISPVHDRPAIEPLTLADAWLSSEGGMASKQFALLHLRGGHPPFDVPPERARELPPIEYGGDLDPRRAALQLASVRARPRAQLRKLLDEDWTRLDALQKMALEKQDIALGRLFRKLQERQLWDDALIVVMGDVSTTEAPEVPFAPEGPLHEQRLHAPLLVKWPGGTLAGHEVSQLVTTTDLSTMLLKALGIKPPDTMEGRDLREVAAGQPELKRRTLHATVGATYTTRAGEWRLDGDFGSVPTLCHLAPDPACVNDLLDRYPLVARALWQWTYRRERRLREAAPEHKPLELSPETQAALTVWGYWQ